MCLGVARSASSPIAAQALGSSLTPHLRIWFGRVTCMALAASVPRLWTLGFLLALVFGSWFRGNRANPSWGLACVCFCRGALWVGGCLAAVLVPWLWPAACLSGVPRGPAWCAASRPVRSLSVLWSAFPSPWWLPPSWGLPPPDLLGGCAGEVEAGQELDSRCLPMAPAEAGALGWLRVVPVRGPAMGLSLAGPSGVGLGLLALRWFGVCGPGH